MSSATREAPDAGDPRWSGHDAFRAGTASGAATRALFVGRILPHKGVGDLNLVDAVGRAVEVRLVGPRAGGRDYVERLAEGRADGRPVSFVHGLER